MRILVVDLSSVFWSVALGRTFQHTNHARNRVVREINSIARDGYDRVAIAVDGPGRPWRCALWGPYKAGRETRPEHLWSLLEETVRHLDAAGYHVFRAPEAPGGGWYEADDVIGSICAWARREGIAVDILSGDSDLAACVSDGHRIRMLYRHRGIAELDEAGVEAKWGVWPWEVSARKAVAGDRTDGYGNLLPGVGTELAQAMLEEANWDPIVVAEHARAGAAGRGYDVIRKVGEGRIWTGLELARLRVDVPLCFDELLVQRAPRPVAELFADLAPDADGEAIARAESAAEVLTADPRSPSGARLLVSPVESRARLEEFRAWCEFNLVENVDFGLFPGWDKPGLLHPGAQKLASAFGLEPSFKVVHREVRLGARPVFFGYEVKCVLRSADTRRRVGDHISAANSLERYWAGSWETESFVPPHLDLAKLEQRIVHVGVSEGKPQKAIEYFVPNPSPAGLQNAVLSMAEKRAFVTAVIRATRCAGVFEATQNPLPSSAYGAANVLPQWEQDR